jgi:hypothetical protein
MLEGFDAYLMYRKPTAANKSKPSAVLIAPILRLQIAILGFFIPLTAVSVYA